MNTFLTKLILGHLVPRISPLVDRLRFMKGTLFVPCFLVKIKVLVGIGILFNRLSSVGMTNIVVIITLLNG